MELERLLAQYDFLVRKEQIAETPAHPRDSAKLLVYNRATETAEEDTFLHLDKYLDSGTLLILNNTKVVPARLPCFLPTGGKVELLWIAAGVQKKTFEALSPRILEIGSILSFGELTLTVLSKIENIYVFIHSGTAAQFHAAMMKNGTTPIPPYLKHTSLEEKQLRAEYQTIFAKREGSVAAPTASLHFTKRLFTKLKKKGVKIAYVTLHVNLGTFAPLTEEHLKSGKLHEEWYEIPRATARAIAQAKQEGRPVIPVGTTALRTIESAFFQLSPTSQKAGIAGEGLCSPTGRSPSNFPAGKLCTRAGNSRLSGITSLFIREGYQFKVADGLITNFHVPRSSLLMLVAALVGYRPGLRHADGRKKILDLYQSALRSGFRFFSFGDGMLIR